MAEGLEAIEAFRKVMKIWKVCSRKEIKIIKYKLQEAKYINIGNNKKYKDLGKINETPKFLRKEFINKHME